VTRSLTYILLLLGAVSAAALSSPASSSKVETVRGRVVAYSNVKMCGSTNALWSMIIRIADSTTRGTAKFIRVEFSLPCADKLPTWVTRNASVQTFRLSRKRHEYDAILREFMDCQNETPPTSCAIPMWKRVSGTVNEELPFGQRLPEYESVEFPPRFN
jgi:hypothetical protein